MMFFCVDYKKPPSTWRKNRGLASKLKIKGGAIADKNFVSGEQSEMDKNGNNAYELDDYWEEAFLKEEEEAERKEAKRKKKEKKEKKEEEEEEEEDKEKEDAKED